MNYRKLRKNIIDKHWNEETASVNDKVDRICSRLSKKISGAQSQQMSSLSDMYLRLYE
jgi:hypothetical protein